MEVLDSFGEWMRRRREAHGLTRQELAGRAGCSVSALRKIEADDRRPSTQLAGLLADCLQISPEERPHFLAAARGVRRVGKLGRPELHPVPLPAWPVTGHSPVASTKTITQPAWNLPASATPLIGREAELATLAQLLSDPGCRLLTLVGPGGIGKTRLATEVSCNVWDRFADGVYYAPLAATSSAEFMVLALARATGMNLSATADARTQLMNILANKQVLLLLDNLEHLLDGVDVLVELLAGAPALKLLVTSRERLRLSGEWAFEVQGLSVPTKSQPGDAESFSAVQLFLQSARQARVDFELSAENVSDVVAICRMVEGLPLAIELAAAWVPVLSCTEIAKEIGHGLDLLASRQRDRPDRQRSLRAVFDHSWQFLNQEQQRVLRQLSIFRGGFQRAAAENVASANLLLLLALAEKSLLRYSATGRYEMPETIRQYAAEKFEERADERAEAQARHASYYIDLLHRYEVDLGGGAAQNMAQAIVEDDLENVRLAWHFAISHQHWDQVARGLDGLFHLFEMRGQLQEGVDVFQQALDTLSPDCHTRRQRIIRSTLLSRHGWFAYRLGRYEQAQQELEQSLTFFREQDVPGETAFALYNLGILAYQLGRYKEAEHYLQESLAIRRELGDLLGIAGSLSILGIVARDQGQLEEAQRFLNKSLTIHRELDQLRGISRCLNLLALIRRDLGDSQSAKHMLHESLSICRELNDRTGIAFAASILGAILYGMGDYVEAQELSRESLEIREESGDRRGSAFALYDLGNVAVARQEYDLAHAYYVRALHIALDVQAMPLALCVILGLATLKAAWGEAAAAFRLALIVEGYGSSFEMTDVRARELRVQLEDALPATVLAQVREQASDDRFERVAARLLAEEKEATRVRSS